MRVGLVKKVLVKMRKVIAVKEVLVKRVEVDHEREKAYMKTAKQQPGNVSS